MHTAAGILLLDATTLSRRIAAREISCRELMHASLERIGALNPVHNAIVSLRAPGSPAGGSRRARRHPGARRAHRLDARLPGGREGPERRRRPADHAGLAGHRPARPATDALFVQRMKKAGAIVIGKTNTPEFGARLAHLQRRVRHHAQCLGSGAFRRRQQRRRRGGAGPGHGAGGRRQRHGRLAAQPRGLQPTCSASVPRAVACRRCRRGMPSSSSSAPKGPMGRTTEDVARLLGAGPARWPRAPCRSPTPCRILPARTRSPCEPGLRIGWLGGIWPDLPLEGGIRELYEAALRARRPRYQVGPAPWTCRAT